MMRRLIVGALSGSMLVSFVALAAVGQEGTRVPGELTQAKVWIQNRGSGEAVPVSILQPASEPLAVRIAGIPTVTASPSTLVQTRVARQRWEYREVSAAGQDLTGVLNGAGAEGWEAVDSWPGSAGQTVVLMKRPMPNGSSLD